MPRLPSLRGGPAPGVPFVENAITFRESEDKEKFVYNWVDTEKIPSPSPPVFLRPGQWPLSHPMPAGIRSPAHSPQKGQHAVVDQHLAEAVIIRLALK